MLITKLDGSQQEFKPEKLASSLRRSGATDEEVRTIVGEIQSELYEGAPTQEIYRHAFALLKQSTKTVAARYSLRRALFDLGPTGFPFEDFLTRLFEAEGYTVTTGQIVKGKCATHEVDLAAYKGDDSFVAEAKFHARPGLKSDMQVVLYSYARYLDLQQRPVCADDNCGIKSLYVITNTKFTSAATDYANCSGLSLLSWSYPHGNTLQDRIQRHRLYPITALVSLSVGEKRSLLTAGVVLCREILMKPEILSNYGIKPAKAQKILAEARQLCGA